MDKNTQEQLNKLAKVFKTDNIITATEIEQVLVGILQIMNSFKKDNEKLTEETKDAVKSLYSQLAAEHDKMVKELEAVSEKNNSKLQNQFNSKSGMFDEALTKVKKLLEEIKAIDVKDGKDADEEMIIDSVLAKIKLPEYKEIVLDDGEEIVAKINDLSTTEDVFKIDASHIKNLPTDGKKGYSPTVLGNAVDLNQSARADGYAIVWDDVNKNFKFADGGDFSSITGTPTEIAYFDNAGNGTGDIKATRDPNDNFFTKLIADTQAFLFIDEGMAGYSFQAVEHGSIGNTITLVFNGTDDIDTVVTNWNTANPSNTVVLVYGAGTDVLTAATYTLSGGGISGTQIGHHDLLGTEFDGTAIYAKDTTSGAFAGSLFGDASLLGINGLSSITGFVDFVGNNFSVLLNNSQSLGLNYASPAGTAALNMDSNGVFIASGNNWGYYMSENSSEIGWFTSNYNVKLPLNTPNIGDTIQVVSDLGGDYYTNWLPGGGGAAAGSDTWVQFNNAGVFGASSDFTWDDTAKSIAFGGLHDANKSHFIMDNVTGSTGFVMGNGINSYLTVKDKTSGYAVLSLQADDFSGTLGATQGNAPNANSVYFGVNNPGKQLTGYGLSKPNLDSLVHSGGGLNDVTLTPTPFFTGNNSTGIFIATITNTNTQRIDMTPGGFTPPLPGVGDVVTDGTISGTVYLTDGVSSFFVEGVTGGVFGSGVVITGPGGFAGTIQSTDYGFLTDRFTMSYLGGTANQYNVPTLASPNNFYFGIALEFPSVTGYTIGDSWTYSYNVQYGAMLNMSGSPTNPFVTIGDVNYLYNPTVSTAISINPVGGYTRYGGGSIKQVSYVSVASYDVLPTDYYVDVRINSIGAAPDVYLPGIDFPGREYIITDEDGNSAIYPITIHAASGNTFNTTGTSTLIINTKFQSVRIHANSGGTGWVVTSN